MLVNGLINMRVLPPPKALILGAELVFFSRKQARVAIKHLCPGDIYTGKELSKTSWTLEHVVPQSMIHLPARKNDLHNLAGLHTMINSSRGNKAFGDPKRFREVHGCKISRSLFSPRTGKGEVARKCAYMFERYGASIISKSVISTDTMLEWNDRYAPSDDEKRKNELIYKLQGTFNKFVDDSSELEVFCNGKVNPRVQEGFTAKNMVTPPHSVISRGTSKPASCKMSFLYAQNST